MRLSPTVIFAVVILVFLVAFNAVKLNPETCDFYPCEFDNVRYYNRRDLLNCVNNEYRNDRLERLSEDSPANATFWIYFFGDSLLRGMFLDVVALANNSKLQTLPEEDCKKFDAVQGKLKCVCWDYTLPLFIADTAANNKTTSKRPHVTNVRLTFRAKHQIYDPIVDEEVFQSWGCGDLNSTEQEDTPFARDCSNIAKPDFLLLNSGLWDILYNRDFDGYKIGAQKLLALIAKINDPIPITNISAQPVTTQQPTIPSSEEPDYDGMIEVPQTKVLFVGSTAVVPDLLPAWKKPFLANNVIRRYNHFVLSFMKENSVRVLDTFRLTQGNKGYSQDGIHYPGVISKTNTNFAMKALCE